MLVLFPTNYRFLEQTTMFIADEKLLAEQAAKDGGCAEIVANFFIQFFDIPYVGLWITLAILSAIAFLNCSSIKKISVKSWAWLGILPAIALLPLHYIITYRYAGTIAFLFVVIALRLALIPNSLWLRAVLAVIFLPLLYHACGPMPYSNPLSPVPFVVYIPWVLLIAVLVLAFLFHKIQVLNKDIRPLKFGIPALIILGGVIVYNNMMNLCVNRDEEFLKAMNCLVRSRDWDKITFACSRQNMSNLLFQNCAYMAWAEKGELSKHVGIYPSPNHYAIAVEPNRTPYVSAMLSDIYYSIGHISLAQRHAFEANEMYGGYSSRMLQMLVKTNIIFGNYEVAEKYLNLMSKSRYGSWAEDMRRFLYNDDAVLADNELGAKRRCIIPSNSLVGSRSIAEELQDIIEANPAHTITQDYLNAIRMLDMQY